MIHHTCTSKKSLPASVVAEAQDRLVKWAKKREEEEKKKAKVYYDRKAREDLLQEGDEVLTLLPAGLRGITASWEGPFIKNQI